MQTQAFLCGLPLAFQVLSNAFRAERVVDVWIDGVMMIVLIPMMVIMIHIEPAHACTKVVAKFARRDICPRRLGALALYVMMMALLR